MRNRSRVHNVACRALAILLLAPAVASAAEHATDAPRATPRFTLTSSSTVAAPQQSARYALRARFAPVESAGDLREGAHFTLIGRLAKGSVSCGVGGPIFSNGFEGN